MRRNNNRFGVQGNHGAGGGKTRAKPCRRVRRSAPRRGDGLAMIRNRIVLAKNHPCDRVGARLSYLRLTVTAKEVGSMKPATAKTKVSTKGQVILPKGDSREVQMDSRNGARSPGDT